MTHTLVERLYAGGLLKQGAARNSPRLGRLEGQCAPSSNSLDDRAAVSVAVRRGQARAATLRADQCFTKPQPSCLHHWEAERCDPGDGLLRKCHDAGDFCQPALDRVSAGKEVSQ